MASSLLNKLKLIAGESIDTTDPTNPDDSNQAIIDRYKNVPGINVEKLTEYVNLNIPEPQTIVDAIVLAEAIGYTPEQAKVVGAQWAVESGRGVSTAGADYNYFGVKSHNKDVMKRMSEQYGIDVSQGDVVKTVEYINGERKVIEDTFASFNNPIEGFLGKKAFLETNKRYKKALNPENTADEFAQGLKDAGYATDPVYASKLAKIYNGPMRTTRPSWMEPTRKNNVPQADWTMTEVQPTEGSRADLVAEKTNQAIEQPGIEEVLADIKYKPQVPKMPFSTSQEDVQNYLAEKQAYEQKALDQNLTVEELGAQELAAYEANPKSFDNFENMTQNTPFAEPTTASGNFENTMTDEEYDALGIEKPFSKPQIFKQGVQDIPEVSVVRDKKEKIIPLVEPKVDENKYDNLEFLNTLHQPRSTISEGSFTNEARSKEELKQDAAAEKFIIDPLQKNIKSGYFGSGRSMFYPSTRQQKHGGSLAPIIPTYYKSKGTPIYRDTTSLPFKTGGYTVTKSSDRKGKTHKVTRKSDGKTEYYGYPGMGEKENSKLGKEAFLSRHAENLKNNPFFRAYANSTWEYGGNMNKKYFDNGGPEDELNKSTNPINTSKGLFGMLGDAAKYSAARNMSKTELPEQGELSYNEYLNNLNRKQLASIPFKKEMAERDVKLEKDFVEGVQKRMSDIGLERSQHNTPMKEDYDYLGVPFMYNKDSWFHNLKGNRYSDPYSCQGIACAIGRKAGAVNAQDYKTRSAKGKANKPWAIETGSLTVDHADVLAGKGLYPVENIQPGDMVRHGYKSPYGTGHNVIATGKQYISYNDEIEFPAAYASEWQGGVKGSSHYYFDPKEDQAFRYLRNLPRLEKEAVAAESMNEKYQNYLDQKAIANLPIKKAELIRTGPSKMPFIPKKQYPDTRKGRKQEQQDNAYIAAYMARLQKK